MKKLSTLLPNTKLETKTLQNSSSRNENQKIQLSHDAGDEFCTIQPGMLIGDSGAAMLIDQFSKLWQNQWLKGLTPDEIPDLLEAWISELAQLTPAAADRACIVWKNRMYPPDLAAFLTSSHRRDAEDIFRLAEDVANQITPDFSALPPLAYAAGKDFGWPALRETGWHSKHTQERWISIIFKLEKYADLGLLPAPPPCPEGLLTRPNSVMPKDVVKFLHDFKKKNQSTKTKKYDQT